MLRAVLRAGVSCRASRTVARFAVTLRAGQGELPRWMASPQLAAAAAAALLNASVPALVFLRMGITPFPSPSHLQPGAAHCSGPPRPDRRRPCHRPAVCGQHGRQLP